MKGESLVIGSDIVCGNAFAEVDDDAGEAVPVDVNFLVVGNLADGAVATLVSTLPAPTNYAFPSYLASKKLNGRLAVMAPPNRAIGWKIGLEEAVLLPVIGAPSKVM